MIIKSFEFKKKATNFLKHNFSLLYGENFGLKKEIKQFIEFVIKKENKDTELLTIYESDIVKNEENFFNSIFSGSLFGSKKIITIYDCTDKIINNLTNIYSKNPENIFLILFSEVLEKKSKLRNFFEKEEKTICIPCYLDTERDLQFIAETELRKNKINLSRESINLLVEKSNADRINLKNELKKIQSYALNKKTIDLDEIKALINFSGDYKSEIFINECLCGNISQYKKILSEIYMNAINQIYIFRILSKKIQRLLKIKESEDKFDNLDKMINESKPPIFWKEKPLIKKQLSIWNLNDLRNLITEINQTELLCKKNPNISKIIFFDFFSKICTKAKNFS
tara:strand:+ start:567 stop:1586 length:1020 start_codon:yes stop_codon:yes gene_type:complete